MHWTGMARRVLMVALAAVLSACSTLPRSGPSHQSVESNAAVRLVSNSQQDQIPYVMLDISKSILPYFDDTIFGSLIDGFGGGRGAAPETTLGAGDVIQISIFEAQSGGLFIPAESGSRPGNYVTLPAQAIDSDGRVEVPYAGSIVVAGRPISVVEREIEARLANRAIEPQVIITTTLNLSNRLSILGYVNAPAELDVSPRGERILDVISRAGGLKAPGSETYITIERNGRQATAHFDTIIDNPAENIYVRPGDTIYVNRERRTYLAFGAAGANGRFDFEESNLTLGEALGKAGGLLDGRADPSQVFLYREVDIGTLEKAGITPPHEGRGTMVPVVFKADLREPSMFFAVQRFRMQDKDIIYVSNSGSTELTKFLDLINGVSSTAASMPANVVSTRNSIRELGN
jgi:polysaccharide export outer membrane protein